MGRRIASSPEWCLRVEHRTSAAPATYTRADVGDIVGSAVHGVQLIVAQVEAVPKADEDARQLLGDALKGLVPTIECMRTRAVFVVNTKPKLHTQPKI